MSLITCKKSRGGNSLKFGVKSEELRVGGSSWRLGSLFSFILSIIFAFGAATTAEAVIYWTGAQGAAWNNKGNWISGTGWIVFDDSHVANNQYYMEWSENLTQFTYIDKNYKALQFRGGTEEEPFEMNGKGYSYNCSGDKKDDRAKFAIADSTGDSALWFYNGTLKTRTFVAGTDSYSAWLKLGNGSDATTLQNTSGNMSFSKGTFIADKATVTSAGVLTLGSVNLYFTNATTTANGLSLAVNADDISTADKTGGDWTLNGDMILGAASGSTATFTQSSGTVTVKNNKWTKSTSGNGTLNLNGGTFVTQHIEDEVAGGSLTVNFNGGTLKANNANSSGLITHGNGAGLYVNVGEKGGIIDTGALDISIPVDINDASGSTGGMTFTGGGSVKLTGAMNYTGTTTLCAETALSAVENTVEFSGTLAFEASSKLKISRNDPKAVSAASIELPEEGSVVVDFIVSELNPGSYNLLTHTGSGEFTEADARKFVAGENAPICGFSVSEDRKSVVVTLENVPLGLWKGTGDGVSFSDPANWSGNMLPTHADDVKIDVSESKELVCDVSLDVNSITFAEKCAPVTITGEGCITNASTIVNRSESRHVINVPVEFYAEEAYKTIDVSGEVDFQRGVKGTVPVNHTTFYGNYTLTASTWTLSSNIKLAANATLTATAMDMNTAGKLLDADAGAVLTIGQIHPRSGSSIFGAFAGKVVTDKIYPEGPGTFSLGSGFTGELRTKWIYYYGEDNSKHFTVSPGDSSTMIIGGGNGITCKKGYLDIGGQIFRSSGDWSFDSIDNGNENSGKVTVGNNGITVDTSDVDDPTAPGHTVTVKQSASYRDYVLTGNGGVSVVGNGSFVFSKTAQFTGGLTASDRVTISVNNGVYPGKGDVTIKDTATLKLVDSGSGTVPVAGKFTMEGGSTLRISKLVAGMIPLSVSSLDFGEITSDKKINLEINGGELVSGYYTLIEADAVQIIGDVSDVFSLKLSEEVTLPEDGEVKLELLELGEGKGYALALSVLDASDYPSGIWVGGVNSNMSNPLNWKNRALPKVGDNLDFSGVDQSITVNADLQMKFGKVTVGEGVVTFTGELTATEFSDTSKIAVGSNSIVTLDGDLMFSDESGNKYAVYKVNAGGKFMVTGNFGLAEGAGCSLHPQESPGTGVFVVGGFVNNGSANICAAKDNNSTTQHWAIGLDGITGTTSDKGIWVYSNDKVNPEFQPNANDFTVSLWTCLRENAKSFTYNTTGLDGNGYTITLDAGFSDIKAPLYVTGSGKVVVNHVTQKFGGKNAYSGPVTVKDTATLAINSDKKLTTGAITINSGATLQVGESGAVQLGGDLTLKNGACLGFNYTTRNPPVLNLTDRNVTFEEGESTNIVVKISSSNGKRPYGGVNVLTSGGKFSGVTVSKAADNPDWVKDIYVDNDGNIVLLAKPRGTRIIVR